MDQSEKSSSVRYRHQRKNPSFSSSLLDEIYRSIDEGNGEREEELVFYRETTKKKQSTVNERKVEEDEEMASFRRACLVEKWMEKKVSEKVVVRRKSDSLPDFDRNLNSNRSSMVFNSSSSSSDSCCGGGFSSSEAESVYGTGSRSRPKPVRTNVSVDPNFHHYDQRNLNMYEEEKQLKSKHGNGFIKTKSRAMKIYGDLKKVKQPISPGGRLASFINSLFTAGNPKKPKFSSTSSVEGDSNFDRKSTKSTTTHETSTCSSSVSSFSRSCLSKTKTPSSSSSTRIKRSVRFYPVSVIVDEDCRPCGHKCLYEDDEPGLMAVTKVRKIGESSPMMLNEELKFHIMEKNRRIEEAARDLLLRNGYQKKKSNFDIRDLKTVNYDDEEDDDDDDDDAASCSSSDLFELDNIGSGGIERYREELPVYETTHLGRNRAIANGLIL